MDRMEIMRFISMVWMRINGRERSSIQVEAMTTADFRSPSGKWHRTRTFIDLKMQTAVTRVTRR